MIKTRKEYRKINYVRQSALNCSYTALTAAVNSEHVAHTIIRRITITVITRTNQRAAS